MSTFQLSELLDNGSHELPSDSITVLIVGLLLGLFILVTLFIGFIRLRKKTSHE